MSFVKGQIFTEEHKRKLSESHKGIKYVNRKKISEEDKLKLSEAHKGIKNTLGKTWKIDPAKLANRKLKQGNHTGCKHSEETKKRIQLTKKAAVTPEYIDHCRAVGLKGRLKQLEYNGPTSLEAPVISFLKENNINFIFQYKVDDRWLCDFYVPSINLIIECDGEYWHNLDKVKIKDKVKNAYLKQKGYDLLRILEVDIKNDNYKSILKEKLVIV
jgi:very-short-patch-repair endonuclease